MNEDIKNHINEALKKGVRLDGRSNEDFRKLEVTTGVIATAEGSALVKCGNAEVIAGVKLQLTTPYPDSQDEGTLMVGSELLPLSNPEFESGPPSIDSIEIARVIDRGIREGHAMDVKKLCIKKGELVWSVLLDIVPINYDGNMIDIGGLAAMAALKDAKLLKVEDNKPVWGERTKEKLPLQHVPLPITIVKIGDSLIVDPTDAEEKVLDARLTITIMEDGNLCAMQKGGDATLTVKDINDMLDLAVKKNKEIRKILDEAVK